MIFPEPDGKGGMPYDAAGNLGLGNAYRYPVVYETVDVTLKVLQYIESKQNKKD